MKDKGYFLGTSQHFSWPTVHSLNPTDRLVLLFFQNDKQKEWIYKGSEKLEHILNIKKRLAKDKPQKTQHKPQQPPQQTTQQHPPQQKTQQHPPQEKTQQLQQLSQQKTQEPAITGRLLRFLHILPLLCTFPHRHVQVFIYIYYIGIMNMLIIKMTKLNILLTKQKQCSRVLLHLIWIIILVIYRNLSVSVILALYLLGIWFDSKMCSIAHS